MFSSNEFWFLEQQNEDLSPANENTVGYDDENTVGYDDGIDVDYF